MRKFLVPLVVLAVVPASSTLATFGWSIRASVCRSASNRARMAREFCPGRSRITFTATSFRNDSRRVDPLGPEELADGDGLACLPEELVPVAQAVVPHFHRHRFQRRFAVRVAHGRSQHRSARGTLCPL